MEDTKLQELYGNILYSSDYTEYAMLKVYMGIIRICLLRTSEMSCGRCAGAVHASHTT